MDNKSLVNGRLMTCPRCEKQNDILSYIRFESKEEYAKETTPVYKCSFCKWIFAPAGDMPQDIYRKFEDLLEKYQTGERVV